MSYLDVDWQLFATLHAECLRQQVSYQIHYLEGSHHWNIVISGANEQYLGRDWGVLQNAIDHAMEWLKEKPR